jgi:glycosyltransferase involved in cell wall biosynthesis
MVYLNIIFMDRYISIVIANHNKAETIGKCLESIFSSRYKNFEVIVVDDHSEDNSVEVIKNFPCKLISLESHMGASKARNIGALNSKGEVLFFIDADCLLLEDTLSKINKTFAEYNSENNIVIGGTYTPVPYDDKFFSTFQSIFINYSETKNKEPDYIATHAMVIDAQLFRQKGGFPIDFLPILEDVEFSHRLRKAGVKLLMNPDIVVRHIFNFSLMKSLQNAFRKSKYWTIYSIKNKDLFRDSGTASVELKVNVISSFLCILLLAFFASFKKSVLLFFIPLIVLLNLWISRGLLKAFYRAKGLSFFIMATLYYVVIYPIGVGTGCLTGLWRYLLSQIYRKWTGKN